jgi:type IV pilus assembly protein PilW
MIALHHTLPRGLQWSHQKSRGFTLVELMVAIALGVGIIAGLMVFMANNSTNFRTNERASEVLINGRFALNSVRQELLHAGSRAYTLAEPNMPLNSPLGAIGNECLELGATTGSFVSNIRQGVWGSNNTNPFAAPFNCLSRDDSLEGEDVLLLRRVHDVRTNGNNLFTSTFYFSSSYGQGEFFRGLNTPTFALTSPPPVNFLQEHFAVKIYMYYLSPYTVSATEDPKVPALYRVALNPNGVMAPELVASGIEHFQVQYALSDTDLSIRYYDANDIASFNGTNPSTTGASFYTASATDSGWNLVSAVRVWLLARNSTPEPGYTNTNTYVMGDKTYTASDGYRRQLFSTIVQLRNHER